MTTFELVLQDMTQTLHIEHVKSFIARDTSGSFGIQAGHENFITCLQPGLARFCTDDGQWCHIAQPGTVVNFSENCLHFSTTQFIINKQRDVLLSQMEEQWQEIKLNLGNTKQSIAQMEQALTKKMWELSHQGKIL